MTTGPPALPPPHSAWFTWTGFSIATAGVKRLDSHNIYTRIPHGLELFLSFFPLLAIHILILTLQSRMRERGYRENWREKLRGSAFLYIWWWNFTKWRQELLFCLNVLPFSAVQIANMTASTIHFRTKFKNIFFKGTQKKTFNDSSIVYLNVLLWGITFNI